jgi:hypothetical protein
VKRAHVIADASEPRREGHVRFTHEKMTTRIGWSLLCCSPLPFGDDQAPPWVSDHSCL